MEKIECKVCHEIFDIHLLCKNPINKARTLGLCKKCKADGDRVYNKKNKEKISAQRSKRWREDPEVRIKSRRWQENLRTGMDATEYAKDKSCEICNMSNREHIEKYNTRLHVHHKDDNGRHNINRKMKPNHSNIQILCASCHSKENNKHKDYVGMGDKVWKVRIKRYGKSGLKINRFKRGIL